VENILKHFECSMKHKLVFTQTCHHIRVCISVHILWFTNFISLCFDTRPCYPGWLWMHSNLIYLPYLLSSPHFPSLFLLIIFFFCPFLFIYLFISSIHMCIHCLGHFSPLPPAPHSLPFPPSLSGRICSALISNFVEERVWTIIRKTKYFC
jgi:hypothetical protein